MGRLMGAPKQGSGGRRWPGESPAEGFEALQPPECLVIYPTSDPVRLGGTAECVPVCRVGS